jgi:hypothetical protein
MIIQSICLLDQLDKAKQSIIDSIDRITAFRNAMQSNPPRACSTSPLRLPTLRLR